MHEQTVDGALWWFNLAAIPVDYHNTINILNHGSDLPFVSGKAVTTVAKCN